MKKLSILMMMLLVLASGMAFSQEPTTICEAQVDCGRGDCPEEVQGSGGDTGGGQGARATAETVVNPDDGDE